MWNLICNILEFAVALILYLSEVCFDFLDFMRLLILEMEEVLFEGVELGLEVEDGVDTGWVAIGLVLSVREVDLVEGLLEVGVVGFCAGVDGKPLFFVGCVWSLVGKWVVVDRAGGFFVMIEFSGIALANDKFGGFVGLYFF